MSQHLFLVSLITVTNNHLLLHLACGQHAQHTWSNDVAAIYCPKRISHVHHSFLVVAHDVFYQVTYQICCKSVSLPCLPKVRCARFFIIKLICNISWLLHLSQFQVSEQSAALNLIQLKLRAPVTKYINYLLTLCSAAL